MMKENLMDLMLKVINIPINIKILSKNIIIVIINYVRISRIIYQNQSLLISLELEN